MRDEAEHKGDSEAVGLGGRRCRDAEGVSYLPPTRELRVRLDTAQTLTRLLYREQAVVLACGGWTPRVGLLEHKAELARTAWESALAGDALRQRVFELRYPVRFLDEQGEELAVVGPDDLRRLVAELRGEYLAYLGAADELADGPPIRLVEAALRDKQCQQDARGPIALAADDPARDQRYLAASFDWRGVPDHQQH